MCQTARLSLRQNTTYRLSCSQERMCRMKLIVAIAAIGVVLSTATRAQEPTLINEIVARVNSDIITLADYSGAIRDLKEQLTREMAGKSEAEVNAEFERVKPTVLDF